MATYTTELEAVNTMLRYIGESPVNSITGDSLPISAVLANTVLDDITREVQLEGWHFNTVPEVTLSPDASNKEIVVDLTVVKADPNDVTKDFVLRGKRLFDRKKNTYEFDNDVKVNLTELLAWNYLPEAARRYITLRASRVFCAQMLNSREMEALLARDEYNAKAELMESDSSASDRTIFDNFDTGARIGINRNYDIS